MSYIFAFISINVVALNQFPGGNWPPGFMEYAFSYFRSPGGTKVEGVSDKFIAIRSDFL